MTWLGSEKFHEHVDGCERCRTKPFDLCELGGQLLLATGGEERETRAVVFRGCRVVEFETLRIYHPQPLPRPALLLEPLGHGPDGLLLTSLVIGGEEQLAVPELPAALFELPAPLTLAGLSAGAEMVLKFANRASEPASFVMWLGSSAGIAAKFERLQEARTR